MKRVPRILVLAMFLVSCLALPAAAQTSDAASASRVIIVLAPYLRWSDLSSGRTPALMDLASRGAVGDLNTRNRNSLAGAATPDQGALTLSAGSWAAEDPLTPTAYSAGEYYEGGAAADAFARMTGEPAGDSAVLYLGMPRFERLAASSDALEVVAGTLGGAIVDAGGVTAAVGNSDYGYEVKGYWRSRPAGIVAMDYEGRVTFGDVSADLTKNEPAAPFGTITDLDAFQTELDAVMQDVASAGGPSLIVLDPGDLQRAREFSAEVAPVVAAADHSDAVARLDAIVAMAREHMGPKDMLMIVPQAVDERPGRVANLAPIIVGGEGWQGYLTSSSTQRPGLVTNLDIAATVLQRLGIERPAQILGNPMGSDGVGATVQERMDELVRINETAVAVDTAKPAVLNSYIAIATVILLLSTVALLRGRRWSVRAMRFSVALWSKALLVVLAVPPASILMFSLDASPTTAGATILTFAIAIAVLAVIGLALQRWTPLRVPVAVLSLIATVSILVDQWAGAPWSFSSFLGYSPLYAARYYGMGNEGAALLVGSALVGMSLLFDQYPDAALTKIGKRVGIPLVGILIVGTAAAPFFGANVGVVAWGVVAFAVFWAQVSGVKLGWKVVAASLVVIILVVAVFSAVDLTSGTGSQTHLGRAWSSAASGGLGELWIIIVRKAETNMRVFAHTNWSYLLAAILMFLGFMRWRPQGDFAATLDVNPAFASAMTAALIGGGVAYLTEDSGIVIPALIFLYVGSATLYLMLSRLREVTDAADGAAL